MGVVRQGKVTKRSVNYRTARWTGDGQRCATCSMFRRAAGSAKTGSCTLVAGLIRAGDVCDRWEPKR